MHPVCGEFRLKNEIKYYNTLSEKDYIFCIKNISKRIGELMTFIKTAEVAINKYNDLLLLLVDQEDENNLSKMG